jgi:alkanesulfonate monooxygenase SsuD/methylene tetrahydromethanopterin reductase-like flavin-dependent oxidoreductase (luciferase family)
MQQPYPPIWIGGSGPKRTLRIAAEYADVWNAAGGSPEEVAASSAILDRHCTEVGRDASQIRRSVQFRVGVDDLDQVRATADGYVKAGVTDFLLIVQGADPVAIGERLGDQLRGCASSADPRRLDRQSACPHRVSVPCSAISPHRIAPVRSDRAY